MQLLPNKQEKLELIIQKLTEIGISHIFLWSSDRSQIQSLNENRIIRKLTENEIEQLQIGLPRKYQRVEYIESTGTQYIDTGFMATGGMKVTYKACWTDRGGYMVGSHNAGSPFARNGGYRSEDGF